MHKYDVRNSKDVAVVKLGFMPDNLTWTKNGRMLSAGIQGARGECPTGPCRVAFGVSEIDPATMTAKTVYDSPGKLISGVSVALRSGHTLYVGAVDGDPDFADRRRQVGDTPDEIHEMLCRDFVGGCGGPGSNTAPNSRARSAAAGVRAAGQSRNYLRHALA